MIPLPTSSLLAGQLAGCQALQGRGIQFTCDRQGVGALEAFNGPAGAWTCHTIGLQRTITEAGQSLLGRPGDELL